MRARRSLFAFGLALLSSAAAAPASSKAPIVTQCSCNVVKGLMTGEQQRAHATAFCSSYLSVPVVTETVTATGTGVYVTARSMVCHSLTRAFSSTTTETLTIIGGTATATEPDVIETATNTSERHLDIAR
jgi:hypothetical protein